MPFYSAHEGDVQPATTRAQASAGLACRCCPGGSSRSTRARRYPSDMTEADGSAARMHDDLRERIRLTAGRRAGPTAAVIDSPVGEGLGDGGPHRPWLGRAGKLVIWARRSVSLTLEIVKRPDDLHTYKVLPRRWVVERTLSDRKSVV